MLKLEDYKLTDREIYKVKVPKYNIHKCKQEDSEVWTKMLELSGALKRYLNIQNYDDIPFTVSTEFQKYNNRIKEINDLINQTLDCKCQYLVSSQFDLFTQICILFLWIAESEKVEFYRFKKENNLMHFVLNEIEYIPKLNILFSDILKMDIDFFDCLQKQINDEFFNFYTENVNRVIKVY